MRKSIAILLALAWVALPGSGVTAAPAAEDSQVGQVERLEGQARAVHSGARRDLREDAALLFRDLLITGAEARLQAQLADGTALTLGENATLLIDELIYDPASANNSLVIDVIAGAFLFVGGKIEQAANGQVEIRTPVGSIGVRGTTVWGGRIDGGFGVLVLDGLVTVDTPGGSVSLSPGQGTTILDPTAGPSAPIAWNQSKIDRAVATISFAE